jgi:hypothetical protein
MFDVRLHVSDVALNDKRRSGRPRTATDEAHRNSIFELIKENGRISQQVTANKISFLRECRRYSLISDTERCTRDGYHEWSLRTETQADGHLPTIKLLLRYEREGDECLYSCLMMKSR